ncbi:MAG: calcium-binding protein [Rhodobacteraceae bacterium]|nr:calcium-binding protein [Paracoccaceae bacterium]
MATANFTSISNQFDLWHEYTLPTPSLVTTILVRFDLSDGTFLEVEGFFTVNTGKVTGGTITNLTHLAPTGTDIIATVTGVSVPYLTFESAPLIGPVILLPGDQITWDAGDMEIYGFAGDDTFVGSLGTDDVTIHASGGSDTIDLATTSGSLDDWIDYSTDENGNTRTSGVYVKLNSGNTLFEDAQVGFTYEYNGVQANITGTGAAHTDNFDHINHIRGGSGNDILVGAAWYINGGFVDSEGSRIEGKGGNDSITAFDAYGGSGDDNISLIQAGTDSGFGFITAGTANGGSGNDTFIVYQNFLSDQYNYVIIGGSGVDNVELTGTANFASYNLTGLLTFTFFTGAQTTYTVSGVETIIDGNNDSEFFGDANDNTFEGHDGADVIHGDLGADSLDGGVGVDKMDYSLSATGVNVDLVSNTNTGGHADGDTLIGIENVTGSALDDVISADGMANTLIGGGGHDRLLGQAGNDVLYGGDDGDRLKGQGGFDTIYGGDGQERIWGGGAQDHLEGGAGNDTLFGGNGKDTLLGDNGADTLEGGGSNDTVTGGNGSDIFMFGANSGRDYVTDFQDGSDLLRIADHVGGFATLTINDAGADLKIIHDGGFVYLVGMAGTTLTAADFDFV